MPAGAGASPDYLLTWAVPCGDASRPLPTLRRLAPRSGSPTAEDAGPSRWARIASGCEGVLIGILHNSHCNSPAGAADRLIDPAARTQAAHAPRQPAAGTPEGMNAAASLPDDRTAHVAGYHPHSQYRSRPRQRVPEEGQRPGRSSRRALTCTRPSRHARRLARNQNKDGYKHLSGGHAASQYRGGS